LPWRLGAREAVTASPCRGKLGFKSQEQRSNEVLNYFFLLENISMIWSTRFLFLNMALWNQYPFAQFLPRWTMWMWDKVIMKVYWTWGKGTKKNYESKREMKISLKATNERKKTQ
jgi:hypothetical protein